MLHFKLLSALAFVCLPAAADTVNELAVTHVDSTLSDVARTPRKVGQFFQQANPSIKFGGYIMTKYSISDRSGQKSNGGFDLRFLRLYVDGKVYQDFYYKFQLEVNGAPGEDKGPRIVDAFVEWQKFDCFRVKMGQFKRSFGFENP